MLGGKTGSLFCHRNEKPLRKTTLTSSMRSAAARAGLWGNFSGHSFWIGAEASAAAAGIPDHVIETMGRLLSNPYQLHLRTPVAILDAIPQRITYQINDVIESLGFGPIHVFS